jgi:hypothetical protein
MPAAICPPARWNGACANAKMISAADITAAASVRAKVSLTPNVDNSAGKESTGGAVCDACSRKTLIGAIRPFRVVCAAMPSTITTTSERRLPRPSNTSAREPQPFDITMP